MLPDITGSGTRHARCHHLRTPHLGLAGGEEGDGKGQGCVCVSGFGHTPALKDAWSDMAGKMEAFDDAGGDDDLGKGDTHAALLCRVQDHHACQPCTSTHGHMGVVPSPTRARRTPHERVAKHRVCGGGGGGGGGGGVCVCVWWWGAVWQRSFSAAWCRVRELACTVPPLASWNVRGKRRVVLCRRAHHADEVHGLCPANTQCVPAVGILRPWCVL